MDTGAEGRDGKVGDWRGDRHSGERVASRTGPKLTQAPAIPDPVSGSGLPLGSGSWLSPVIGHIPHGPTKHLPLLSGPQGPPLPSWAWPSWSWGAGGGWWPRPGPAQEPAGWTACLHGSVCLAWAGLGKTMGLLSCRFPPQRSLPGPCPARPAWRPAGSSCRPRRRPQAHLLPGQPLSTLPTPDVLATFPCWPHRRGCHPSWWIVPWSCHQSPPPEPEQGGCSQGRCPTAGEFRDEPSSPSGDAQHPNKLGICLVAGRPRDTPWGTLKASLPSNQQGSEREGAVWSR